MIVIKELRKSFNQNSIFKKNVKVAVNNINLKINDGETFGILGPNGAGKTTLLRILSTLIKPDSGTAILNGKDILKDSKKVRERIGFLTSELKLDDNLTPDYLFNYFGSLYNINQNVINERKEYLFKLLEIEKFKDIKYQNLSTGMKQKTSLVISVIHNPDIIIFDEPTNGLDIVAEKVVIEFLEHLHKEGKTILLSTHIFSLINKLCQRAAILIDGKVVDVVDDLVNTNIENRFFELYGQRN